MFNFNYPNQYLHGSIGIPGGISMGLPLYQQPSKNKGPDYDFSFPGLTKSNIQYLKKKTRALSDIYNVIFSNICNHRNRDENIILRHVKRGIESKYKDYLKDFCIGDNPMHLPPNVQPNVTISDACISHIPEIVHRAIYFIRNAPAPPNAEFSITRINEYIIAHLPTLSPHETQFLTGVIHGSIRMALRSTGPGPAPVNIDMYNGDYGIYLASLNAYNNNAQAIIPNVNFVGAIMGIAYDGANPAPAVAINYANAIANINNQLDIEAKRVANRFSNPNNPNNPADITSKIIAIGIAIGYNSVAHGYGLGLQTHNGATFVNYNAGAIAALRVAARPPIIATATQLTTNLINAILPPQPTQPGNCITPIFSDDKLLSIIQGIKDTPTKLAVVCSREIKIDIQFGGNHNENHPFIDVLKLLQEKPSEQEFICKKSGHGYYCEMKNSNERCDLCIKWSIDRKLFREVLMEMLNSNDFLSNKTLDMMKSSIRLLPANLLEKDQYVKFNQSLIDYKEMKRQNRINHGFN